MTSASELFHTRRFHRFGVLPNADLDLTFDSSTSPNLHHHLRRHRHRSSHTERAADRFVRRNHRPVVDDSDDSAENGRGISVNVSDRLPVEVILARERLFERLRGDPVSTYRQHGRDSMVGDEESEVSNDVPTRGSLVTDLTSEMGRRSQFLRELDRKPPGLTQEDINCLYLEVFSSRVTGSKSRVMLDCSICLDSFTDGDNLISLSCGHKFHSACLNPWIRSCGDCPYCRRGIVVNSHLPKKRMNSLYYIG